MFNRPIMSRAAGRRPIHAAARRPIHAAARRPIRARLRTAVAWPCLALGLAVGLALGAAAAPARADTAADTLSAGAALTSGHALVSPDGHFTLLMQSDGNLVEYITGGREHWATGTSGSPGARAVMQQDGNLVVMSAANVVLWSSGSQTTDCPRLVLQDDGNIVVYGTTAIWAASTVVREMWPGDKLMAGWSLYSIEPEHYRLTMQSDGNLVLYDGAGHALWASGTGGHSGAYAQMQSDGNLVVYGPGGKALWSTATSGHPGARLVLEGAGNLLIYDGSTQLWSSATKGKGSGTSVAPVAPPPVACPAPPPPPAPPAPPPAPAPVSTTPVTTPLPTAPQPRALRIRLELSWTWDRSTTRLRHVKVGTFPFRTQLVVRCAGRGCPRHERRVTARGRRSLRRVLRRLEGHHYRAGDRLTITLHAPGYRDERAQVSIRWGRRPRIRLLSH